MNGETGGTRGGRGVLGARGHGIVDYVTVLTFLLAPTLFDFGGWPAAISYLLAGVHLLLTLATRFPFGMFDAVPLRAHGVIELVVGLVLIALPWILADLFIEPGAQWFFVGIGVVIFVVWALTDYGHGPARPAGSAAEPQPGIGTSPAHASDRPAAAERGDGHRTTGDPAQRSPASGDEGGERPPASPEERAHGAPQRPPGSPGQPPHTDPDGRSS